MITGVESGKRKAIVIVVLSSLALVLALALMLAAIHDYREQLRASPSDNMAFAGDGAAGTVPAQDSGLVGAGSKAGDEAAVLAGATRPPLVSPGSI